MSKWWAVLALLTGGCFSKPGFGDQGRVDAAGDGRGGDGQVDAPAVTCESSFGTPVGAAGLTTGITSNPTIRADLLEVYWSFRNSAPLSWEIRSARRTATGSAFMIQSPSPALATGSSLFDPSPAITDDGQLLVFIANKLGTPEVVQVVRDGSGMWTLRTSLDFDGWQPITSLDLSGDGLVLSFVGNGGALHVARRTSRTDQFAVDAGMLGTDLDNPTLSGDLLEVLFDDTQSGISRSVRPTGSSIFLGSVPSIADARSPDLTDDGRTLAMAKLGGLWLATRMCN